MPHNLQAERSLLGAALLSHTAREVACTVPVDAYYSPAHQHIATAVTALHLDGKAVDQVTVADKLGAALLEEIGGGAALIDLQINTPSTSSVAYYAEIVLEDARRRRTIHTAAELATAARSGELADVDFWRNELLDVGNVTSTSSWDEIDLEPIVNGDQLIQPPTMLHRDDGQALLYPGQVHAFNAESESGKTWLALLACVEELNTGGHVVYIDLEDSANGITERLGDLGAHLGLLYGPDRLFHYVRPDDPIDPTAVTRLARIGPTLVVIDGVTEAMTMNGLSIKENDDAAVFLNSLPRVFARAGAAVILIDHVVKNKQERGDDAIGAQHKRAGIAASYKLETLRPFGRGMAGASRLIVTKDRPGHVRPGCVNGRTAGELRLSSNGHAVTAQIVAPSSIIDPDATFRPTVLMQRISETVEQANAAGLNPSTRDITTTVAGKSKTLITALNVLVDEHYLEVRPGPRNTHLHVSARPYREADDPASPIFAATDREEMEEVGTF